MSLRYTFGHMTGSREHARAVIKCNFKRKQFNVNVDNFQQSSRAWITAVS